MDISEKKESPPASTSKPPEQELRERIHEELKTLFRKHTGKNPDILTPLPLVHIDSQQ